MQSKNKKLLFKKSIYYLVGFAPLIITLFIYTYIPEQVPSHYTTVGEIANWDHKGKVLIIPFLLAAFTYFKPRVFVEKFESQSEKNVSDAATMLFLISINLLSMLELFISLKGEDFLSKFNFYNLLSCIICFIFIFLGYSFPPLLSRAGAVSFGKKWMTHPPFCPFSPLQTAFAVIK